jgi:hypothetical protein
MKTISSFVTYIDESGDEGFVFKPCGAGSSRWFVLSTLVIRNKNDHQLIDCLAEARDVLKKPRLFPLHFKHLKHEQRVPCIKRLVKLPIWSVNIMIYKPAIKEPEKFQNESYLLYRYATRLLLERVSWLCRDHRIDEEGDGFTEIIFSNRSNMSYDKIRDYLNHLIRESNDHPQQVQLDRNVIDPSRIQAIDHAKRAGLQAADAIASSYFTALNLNRYGETENSYMKHLEPVVYHHKQKRLGYGLKFWPGDYQDIKQKAPEVIHFEGI